MLGRKLDGMWIDSAVSKRLARLLLCLLAASLPEARLKSQSLSPVNAAKETSALDALLERRPLLQISGPNPIMVRGNRGANSKLRICWWRCDDLLAFATSLLPGGVGRKAVYLQPGVPFIRVAVKNTGKSAGLADYEVVTTLSR
jgi:hypothetical protein